MTKTKKRVILLICEAVVALALAVFCLCWFVFQVPLFDRGGWHETRDGALQYWDYYGSPLTHWQTVDGQTYYFDADSGNMVTGWLQLETGSYYLTQSGTVHTGWLELDEKQYYFDEAGVLQTGWLQLADGRRYMGPDGTMHTGWLECPEGTYYLLDTGLIATGWVDTDRGCVYLDDQGLWQRNWLRVQEGVQYLLEDGTAHTGWLDTAEGRYYFDEAGLMQTGWQTLGGSRYYFAETGLMQTGWLTQEDSQYYLDREGKACTGWQTVDGVRCYFDSTGQRLTGWITNTDGRYYLYENGSLATGFVEIGGIERYFTDSGEYIPLINPWNEVPDDYTLNLVSMDGYRVDASCKEMLKALLKACNAAGYSYCLNSAYRNLSTQQSYWNKRYNSFISQGYSADEAKKLTWRKVAYPGTSEHHTGLAVDVGGGEAMYAWMEAHSWEYGFIVRYPEEKTDITGIMYEPWHLRYVGKEMAEAVYKSGLCLEEYLESLKAQ